MDIDLTAIIAGLGSIATLLTTILTNRKTGKKADMQAKRTNILCLINMDKMSVMEGGVPQNAMAIHELLDEYKALGGNSFLIECCDDYDEWLDSLEGKKKKTGK